MFLCVTNWKLLLSDRFSLNFCEVWCLRVADDASSLSECPSRHPDPRGYHASWGSALRTTGDCLAALEPTPCVEHVVALQSACSLACLEAGLVANELVNFDPTAVIASAHRWSPYERAVILSRALIRYLELVWAEERPEQPFPAALRELAAEVALEVLPHQGIKEVKPERVVESVEKWEQEAEGAEPLWKVTSDEIVERLRAEETPCDLRAVMGQQAGKLRTGLKGVATKVLQQMPHARGDRGARVGRTTSYTWFCGYWMVFVVDAAHQIIRV